MDKPARPAWLIAALRTDHAGEAGAVEIYRGILAVSRNDEVIAFARAHVATEAEHLRAIEELLPLQDRSALVPLWRLMGWITGWVPALVGPTAVFATIEAVEAFVDRHYQAQIDRLKAQGGDRTLAAKLDGFRRDEVNHKNDAASRLVKALPWPLRVWTILVGLGSAAAVAAASRF